MPPRDTVGPEDDDATAVYCDYCQVTLANTAQAGSLVESHMPRGWHTACTLVPEIGSL